MRNRVKRSGHHSDYINGTEGPTTTEQSRGAIQKSDFSPPPAPIQVDATKLQVRVQPTMSSLFADTLLVQELEMRRLCEKSRVQGLTESELKSYKDLVDSLVKLSKEQRAIDARTRMEELTDEQLLLELNKITGDVLGE